MNRRAFLGTVAGSLLAAPLAAEAQPVGRIRRVGVVSPFASAFGAGPSFEAFRQTLRELGYVEGRNVAFAYRWAEGRYDRLSGLTADLVRQRVDVLFASWSTPAALASKKATTTIPIVFAGVGDAVGVGLVQSLARPGGNVTGSTFITEETIGKQLELLKQVVPRIVHVGVVVNPANPVYGPILTASQAPARALGLQLIPVNVQSGEEFEGAVRAARDAHVEGLVVLRDLVVIANQERLLALAATNGLPVMYGMQEFVAAGGLMSYGPNLVEMYRRAAYLVDKILRGAKPADLPVEQATKFDLVINLKTAKAFGLTIPPSLLQRADQVIE
ncbi:MAG TPA: ABC transporter substrate-binding protein [Methylomirabilota bacterium]|jgi:putative ABC transport system substrate-binding protein|nr:ABC transporter substrate-binding protein [Methylomirabilota bacterium]